jgi:hypothetical protein
MLNFTKVTTRQTSSSRWLSLTIKNICCWKISITNSELQRKYIVFYNNHAIYDTHKKQMKDYFRYWPDFLIRMKHIITVCSEKIKDNLNRINLWPSSTIS